MERTPSDLNLKKFYPIKVLPRWKAIEKLKSGLKVISYKSKNKIFYLYYAHRNRAVADLVLAKLMESFQSYLKTGNDEIAKIQLAYLEERQNELLSKLDLSLSDYVAYLKSNWGKGRVCRNRSRVEQPFRNKAKLSWTPPRFRSRAQTIYKSEPGISFAR